MAGLPSPSVRPRSASPLIVLRLRPPSSAPALPVAAPSLLQRCRRHRARPRRLRRATAPLHLSRLNGEVHGDALESPPSPSPAPGCAARALPARRRDAVRISRPRRCNPTAACTLARIDRTEPVPLANLLDAPRRKGHPQFPQPLLDEASALGRRKRLPRRQQCPPPAESTAALEARAPVAGVRSPPPPLLPRA